ncbi:hypothetical protein [Natrinema caseinilyticum]|uniref:hypothetical protein n=1 Tax=Natrinema caseinilyticum TaxID=2961570 RepID=UPI0020C3BF0D|nr:hypothetical protein [Natrinema caseinilyticum]
MREIAMVGLCGIIGAAGRPLDDLVDAGCWLDSHEASTYHDESVHVGYVDHAIDFEDQPVASGDASLWCWGEVLGHERGDVRSPSRGGIRRGVLRPPLSAVRLPFVAGLNSEFAGVVYDRDADTVSVFTDRLGARPIYYTHTEDGALVFSSLLQSHGTHPAIGSESSRVWTRRPTPSVAMAPGRRTQNSSEAIRSSDGKSSDTTTTFSRPLPGRIGR